jgi:multidrug resistance efflux pump
MKGWMQVWAHSHSATKSCAYASGFARVKLMGVGLEVEGHVESISSGIVDPNDGGIGQGLQNVSPIFTWVRLAQRIPVRIHIDRVPEGVKLVAGQTCTVVVERWKYQSPPNS